MNKKEQAEMQELREQLAMAKALKWPSYTAPRSFDYSNYKFEYSKPLQGWFQWSNGTDYRVTLGCSSGVSHSTDNPTKTSTQTGGRFYVSKLDALKVARCQMSERFAKVLAKIDAEISSEEKGD